MYCLGLFWFSLGSGRLVIKFRSVCVCVVCVCLCVCGVCVCLCVCVCVCVCVRSHQEPIVFLLGSDWVWMALSGALVAFWFVF